MIARNDARLLAVELTDPPQDWDAQLRATLHWIEIDRVVRLEEIPVDRRHNAKIDYVQLARQLGD